MAGTLEGKAALVTGMSSGMGKGAVATIGFVREGGKMRKQARVPAACLV